jgi:hypothetical protein
VVICPFVRAQDACETLEFGTVYSLLYGSTTLGAESVQLEGYFLSKQRRNLVDGILFPSCCLFGLVLAVSKYECSTVSSSIPRIFIWTRVEYL